MIINEHLCEAVKLDRGDFGYPGDSQYDFALPRRPVITDLNGECIGTFMVDGDGIPHVRWGPRFHGTLYRLRFPSEAAVLAFYMTHSDYVIWFRK